MKRQDYVPSKPGTRLSPLGWLFVFLLGSVIALIGAGLAIWSLHR